MSETFSNFGIAVVGTGGIDGSSATLPTLYRSGMPSGAVFRIRVEAEIMKVTTGGQASTNWTVARGQEGTSAAAHSEGTPISQPFTAAAITDAIASTMINPMTTSGDIIYGGASGVATRLPKGTDAQVLTLASGLPSWAAATSGSSLTPPNPADWTWLGGITTNYNMYRSNGSTYYFSYSANGVVAKTKAYAGGVGNVIACFQPQWYGNSGANTEVGLGIRESGTGHFVNLYLSPGSDNLAHIKIDTYTAIATKSGSTPALDQTIAWAGGPVYLRVQFASFNVVKFFYSLDCYFWTRVNGSLGNAADLTDSFWTTSGSAINTAILHYKAGSSSDTGCVKILHYATDALEYDEINYPGGEPTFI